MAIFRKETPLWEKITGVALLVILGIMGVCIAMVEYLTLPATTKELLGTIAVRAFIVWWVGVIALALHSIVRYRTSKPYFSMYYSSIGILILMAAVLLSAFLPTRYSNYTIYLASAILSILFFYDLLRAWSRDKHEE